MKVQGRSNDPLILTVDLISSKVKTIFNIIPFAALMKEEFPNCYPFHEAYCFREPFYQLTSRLCVTKELFQIGSYLDLEMVE